MTAPARVYTDESEIRFLRELIDGPAGEVALQIVAPWLEGVHGQTRIAKVEEMTGLLLKRLDLAPEDLSAVGPFGGPDEGRERMLGALLWIAAEMLAPDPDGSTEG